MGAMLTARRVRLWLLLAVVAVLTQEALTTYPDSHHGAGVIWLSLSLVLLWFVYRRSNAARILFAAIAAIGFAIFVLSTIYDPTSTSVSLVLLYGVQTGTMLVRPIKAWTGAEPAVQAASPREYAG